MEIPIETLPREHQRRSPLRLWLKRFLFVALWFAIYLALPGALDTFLGYLTLLALAVWLYSRVCGRLNMPPLPVRFERVERITLTHVLLALLMLFACANYSELVKLNQKTRDLQTDLVDIQNSASDNKDEIKSSLDDVISAIEANQ